VSQQRSEPRIFWRGKDLTVLWRPSRGYHALSFKRANRFFILGIIGSGKSSLLERLGENYLEAGHVIFDLFGSKDGEGLAWLRSPYAENRKILLLCGDSLDVNAPCDVKHVGKLRLRDFTDYQIVISASPLYASMDDEYGSINKVIDLLYTQRPRTGWSKLIFLLVREASNLFYSRMKAIKDQVMAKNETSYLIRESRHAGLACGMDSLKWTSVDVDFRHLSDYLIFKKLGQFMLPRDLRFVYRMIDFNYLQFRMPRNKFAILTKDGNVGVGLFPEVSWHMQEGEPLLKSLGIRIERGEEIEVAESRGAHTTVGDEEHHKIVCAYLDENLSMHGIAKKLERSTKTIHDHIQAHNKSIEKDGSCLACKRMKSPHYIEKAVKNRKGNNVMTR